MISCHEFFNILQKYDFNFFSGIPDSTFKDWMKFLADNNGKGLQNIIACNECEAIAINSGYHLATNKIGVAYMQNSGLGKAVNPLTSLCDPDVYSIPILLMIGWRGEPGKPDAPQHKKMGKITLSLLDTLQIPYSILDSNMDLIELELKKATEYFKSKKGPYALIIRKNLFDIYEMKKNFSNGDLLTREEVLNLIMNNLNDDFIIISSTGYASRELYEYTESHEKDHHRNFYNIGSMGCASSIALSIAIQKPKKKIIIFDGDGAAIMQMGTFTTIGKYSPSNLVHVIFNNHAHETTGGQPTNSSSINFVDIALASNYKLGKLINTKEQLVNSIVDIKTQQGPIVLVINIKMGTRTNLKRPDKHPTDYKEELMKFLTDLK